MSNYIYPENNIGYFKPKKNEWWCQISEYFMSTYRYDLRIDYHPYTIYIANYLGFNNVISIYISNEFELAETKAKTAAIMLNCYMENYNCYLCSL